MFQTKNMVREHMDHQRTIDVMIISFLLQIVNLKASQIVHGSHFFVFLIFVSYENTKSVETDVFKRMSTV